MEMIVVNDPTCTITYAGPAEIDLADWLVAVGIEHGSEPLDGRTFGHPRRSRMGGGMDAITLAVKWGPELYEALQPKEGLIGALELTPVAGGESLTCDVRIRKVPFGTYKPGEIVEVDIPLGVLSPIVWS